MSYDTTGITYLGSQVFDGGRILKLSTTHTDKAIQLYVSGALFAWAEPYQGVVEFCLPDASVCDVFFPLAVDFEDAEADYWSEAFPEAASHGNKLKIQTPQLMAYSPNDRWTVYRGDVGDSSADTLIRDQDFYPGGRRCGGYGLGRYGRGGYGWDGYNSIGYGYHYGYGEYGFDCDMLEWTTEPLPPGTYPVKIVVEDERGNTSSESTDSVVVDTYARPASDLAVGSYTKATDALALSWTASDDIS